MNTLKHKGYLGSADVSFEDNCLFGKLLFVNDLVTFEAQTPEELEVEFQRAVDDYLETCSTLGKSPVKPFTGTFQIRVGEELHRSAAIQAKTEGVSLNEWVGHAIQSRLAAVDGTHPVDSNPDEDLQDLRKSKAEAYGKPTFTLQQVREELESD